MMVVQKQSTALKHGDNLTKDSGYTGIKYMRNVIRERQSWKLGTTIDARTDKETDATLWQSSVIKKRKMSVNVSLSFYCQNIHSNQVPPCHNKKTFVLLRNSQSTKVNPAAEKE